MNRLDTQYKRQTNRDSDIYYEVELYVEGQRFTYTVRMFEASLAEGLASKEL
jgi:hypothetical protein